MRITGGQFGGRNLKVPKTDAIRPTQDRVREALSRGAKSVTFVEKERRHVAVLKENLAAVLGQLGHLGQLGRQESAGLPGQVVVADCYRFIATYSGPGFSIAFADPPYALGEEKGYAQVLATLAERGVVRENGLFIAEMTAVQRAEETPGWDLLRDRTYGKTRLCIWRRL